MTMFATLLKAQMQRAANDPKRPPPELVAVQVARAFEGDTSNPVNDREEAKAMLADFGVEVPRD
jgi:hypothetical protein